MHGVGVQLTSFRASITIQDISTSSLACKHRVLGGADIDNVVDSWGRRKMEENEEKEEE